MSDISNVEEQIQVKNTFAETKENIKVQRREFWKQQLSPLIGEGGNIAEVVKIVVDKEIEADYDSTGAFTQVGFLRRVDKEELPKIARDKLPFSVLLLDMDNLRTINEREGHEKGTEALEKMVEVVGSNIRPGDLIGRWTKGDEFVILLMGCNSEDATDVKERVNQSLKLANINASIGQASGDFQSDFLEIIESSDADMYRVKQNKKQVLKDGTL